MFEEGVLEPIEVERSSWVHKVVVALVCTRCHYLGRWVGGWVGGGWVGTKKVEENEAVLMRCWSLWVGGWMDEFVEVERSSWVHKVVVALVCTRCHYLGRSLTHPPTHPQSPAPHSNCLDLLCHPIKPTHPPTHPQLQSSLGALNTPNSSPSASPMGTASARAAPVRRISILLGIR